jgi:hypothetical protein
MQTPLEMPQGKLRLLLAPEFAVLCDVVPRNQGFGAQTKLMMSPSMAVAVCSMKYVVPPDPDHAYQSSFVCLEKLHAKLTLTYTRGCELSPCANHRFDTNAQHEVCKTIREFVLHVPAPHSHVFAKTKTVVEATKARIRTAASPST